MTIRKAIFSLLMYPFLVIVSTLVLIFGWGLWPVSWGWVVVGWIGTFFVMIVSEKIKNDLEKNKKGLNDE